MDTAENLSDKALTAVAAIKKARRLNDGLDIICLSSDI